MAITRSIKETFPGFGNVTEYVKNEATTITGAATTNFVHTGFRNPVRSGKWRLQVTSAPAGAITGVKVTVTDGSVTKTVFQSPAFAAGELLDICGQFFVEIDVTTVTIAVTAAAGANGAGDSEVAANP